MTPRQILRILKVVSITCCLAAVASGLLAALLPLGANVPAATEQTALRPRVTTTAPTTLPVMAGLERIWSLPLRQKLSDPEKGNGSLGSVPAAIEPPPPLVLVGTIGSSLAMFKSGEATVVRAIGESYRGVKVVAIHPSQVEIQYNGRAMTLNKAPASGQP